MLSREAILKANDLPSEEVAVPEWGGSVLVVTLTGEERDSFEQSIIETKGKNARVNMANARAKLVALSCRAGDGERLFDDTDIAALGRKSSKALDRVYGVAARLSGISGEDIEELAKNS